MERIWKIAGLNIQQGEKVQTEIPVYDTKTEMSVTFIYGGASWKNNSNYFRSSSGGINRNTGVYTISKGAFPQHHTWESNYHPFDEYSGF